MRLFKANGALLEGHFLLSSGLHSDKYLQSALVLKNPVVAETLGRKLADLFPEKADLVVSPALGALIIGHEVARAKNVPFLFTEKNENGKAVLRRGFTLTKGQRVLIIEDVITTGLSTTEVAELVQNDGAVPIGVGGIVCRSKDGLHKLEKFGVPVKTLLELDIQAWPEDRLPLHLKGKPAVKPGSRKL